MCLKKYLILCCKMKLTNPLITIFLFFYGCSNLEFVLQNNKTVLDNTTIYEISGNRSEYFASALIQYFGSVKTGNNNRFILNVVTKESTVKTAIDINQVSSAVQYNIDIVYDLVDVLGNCKNLSKDYNIKFTHYPKSDGYNFGSDHALKESFQKNIFENVLSFKGFILSNQDLYTCINEV